MGLRHRDPGGDGAGRAAFSSRRTELGLWTSDLRGPVVFAASSFAHLQKQVGWTPTRALSGVRICPIQTLS